MRPGRAILRGPRWRSCSRPIVWITCDCMILPALREGATVISDRYDLSSLAYQSATAPAGERVVPWIREINTCALRPDLTLVLDVSAETAEERRRVRGGTEEISSPRRSNTSSRRSTAAPRNSCRATEWFTFPAKARSRSWASACSPRCSTRTWAPARSLGSGLARNPSVT